MARLEPKSNADFSAINGSFSRKATPGDVPSFPGTLVNPNVLSFAAFQRISFFNSDNYVFVEVTFAVLTVTVLYQVCLQT